jgi:hypothetical protein
MGFSSNAIPSTVTFITEFGRKENVRAASSDSSDRRASILRSLGIHGETRLLIEGREIPWSDIKSGDVITVERITDASVFVKTGNSTEAKEFKFLTKDPQATGRMIQSYWPGQSLFRRFERAIPSTWITGETLWILPEQQWHLCVKYEGLMSRIAFINEEQFYRQTEHWVNGMFIITDEEGNEVPLQDTVDTECYFLKKDPYARNITFRWDGLIMSARFDGTNARFWRNVRKLVDARELCLLNNGRFVSPDRAVSKVIYQLVRTENGKVLREVYISRGEHGA